MRIVMIGTFGMRPKMTMSRRALPLARALVARGHRVTIIVPPWDWPADAGVRSVVDRVEISNIALPGGTPGLWYAQVTASLLKATLTARPDVIHAFKPKGFSGMALAALLAMKRAGQIRARLVLDTDDWEGSGGWNEVNPYPRWQRWLFTVQEESLLRTAEAVTAASVELARLTTARRGPNGVYYLPNGVADGPNAMAPGESRADIRSRLAQQHGFDAAAPLLLLYTRFVEYSMHHLQDLLGEVGARLPRATLLVVGTGLLGQERELERLATAGDFALRIVPTGWVQASELPSYFHAADVAVFPVEDTLLNRTKCPMKLVDLLSSGVPVVAERVGQVGEYIEDGVSGLTVRPGDLAAFAQAVEQLARLPEMRMRVTAAARERMDERFRWEVLAETAERAYTGRRPPAS